MPTFLTDLKQYNAVVQPAVTPLHGVITAQPSKNYTTRYLLLAGLADGTSTVVNCATSADSAAMQSCLRQLGAEIRQCEGQGNGHTLIIKGVGGKPKLVSDEPVNPGNAGAVLRLLLAVGALLPEVTFTTQHVHSLGKRPNHDLLKALEQLGCQVTSNDGKLPITIKSGELHGGGITVSGKNSSQFLSGLLFLAPMLPEPVVISVTDRLVSKAPVRQTLEVVRSGGGVVEEAGSLESFSVRPGQYKAGEFKVNGDWPGMAAVLAAVAVTKGSVDVHELYDDAQGEKESAEVLAQMGAVISTFDEQNGIRLSAQNDLRAVEFDGDLATDAVLALMGAACFAKGKTRFYNVSNLRIKECDRITEPLQELRKLGVKCWEGHEAGDADPDAIIIEGNPEGYEGGVTVDGRDDHRVIMLLTIVALRCRNAVRILRAHEISKSYPGFFSDMISLGARIEMEPISE